MPTVMGRRNSRSEEWYVVHDIMPSEVPQANAVFGWAKFKVVGSCPANVWPYTENNICVLGNGHKGNHKDARDREFTNAGYIKKDKS